MRRKLYRDMFLPCICLIAFSVGVGAAPAAMPTLPDDTLVFVSNDETARPGGFGRLFALGFPLGSYSHYSQELPSYMFLKSDPAFMLTNPALQSQYANYVWGNVASFNGYGYQFIGGHIGVIKNLQLGLIASYDPAGSGNLDMLRSESDEGFFLGPSQFPSPNFNRIPLPKNALLALGSYTMGKSVFGLSIGYMNASTLDEDVPSSGKTVFDSYSSMELSARAGMLMTLDKASTVEGFLGYSVSSASVEFERNTTGTALPSYRQSTKLNALRLGGKYSRDISKRATWFVTLEGGYLWRSFSYDGFDASLVIDSLLPSRTAIVAAVGTGLQYTIGRTLLTGGFTFAYATHSLDPKPGATFNNSLTDYTTLVLPRLTLGAESRITDWLTGRLGYVRDFLYRSQTTTTYTRGQKSESSVSWTDVDTTSWNYASNGDLLTLGLGVQVGRMSIDWAFGSDLLRSLLKLELDMKQSLQVYVSMSYNLQ